MRLIDADALIEYTDDRYSLGEIGRRERDDIVNALEYNAPSIEIVHCGDCKYRDRFGCHNPIWGDGWVNYPPPNPSADGFCSYGERSE